MAQDREHIALLLNGGIRRPPNFKFPAQTVPVPVPEPQGINWTKHRDNALKAAVESMKRSEEPAIRTARLVGGAVAGFWGIYQKHQADKTKEIEKRQEIHQLLVERQQVLVELAERKRQYVACREAAIQMRTKKFLQKQMWSMVRHTILGLLTAGIGNAGEAAYYAWDMLSLVDLTDMISDFSDHVDVLQDHQDTMLSTNSDLTKHHGVQFGDSDDLPGQYHDKYKSGAYFPDVTSVTTNLDPQNAIPDSTVDALKAEKLAAEAALAKQPATFS